MTILRQPTRSNSRVDSRNEQILFTCRKVFPRQATSLPASVRSRDAPRIGVRAVRNLALFDHGILRSLALRSPPTKRLLGNYFQKL